MKKSKKEKVLKIGTQKKTVTLEEADQGWVRVELKNREQEKLSWQSDVEENGHVNEQDQTDKI